MSGAIAPVSSNEQQEAESPTRWIWGGLVEIRNVRLSGSEPDAQKVQNKWQVLLLFVILVSRTAQAFRSSDLVLVYFRGSVNGEGECS